MPSKKNQEDNRTLPGFAAAVVHHRPHQLFARLVCQKWKSKALQASASCPCLSASMANALSTCLCMAQWKYAFKTTGLPTYNAQPAEGHESFEQPQHG